MRGHVSDSADELQWLISLLAAYYIMSWSCWHGGQVSGIGLLLQTVKFVMIKPSRISGSSERPSIPDLVGGSGDQPQDGLILPKAAKVQLSKAAVSLLHCRRIIEVLVITSACHLFS